MARQASTKFFLLEQFQNFYTEVLLLKQRAQLGMPAFAVAATATAGSAPGAEATVAVSGADSHVSAIWNTLAVYLDREMSQANRSGSPMLVDLQRELFYVMAAVADEVFVHLQWEGQQYWLEHLLEVRLFRSHIAGERIFRNIQNVLGRQDQAGEELAAIYLTVLALGFRGQFWGSDDSTAIDNYRRELLLYLARSNPRLVDDSKRIFPDAYRYTVQDGVPATLPNPANWWLVVGGVVVAWLLISTLSWMYLTKETREGIRNANAALGALATVKVSSAPNPSVLNQPVTITATVMGNRNAAPTGKVDFSDTLADGARTALCTGVPLLDCGKLSPGALPDCTGNSSMATCQTPRLTTGIHSQLAASYSGDNRFSASQATEIPPHVVKTGMNIGQLVAPKQSAVSRLAVEDTPNTEARSIRASAAWQALEAFTLNTMASR